MPVPSQLAFTGYSLATIFCWGTGDFLGGYAAKRANAVVLTAGAHACGLVLMTMLALLDGGRFPERTPALWAVAGGLSGGGALAIFYRALASGKMGMTAPISAVLAAAISVAFGMFTEGLPHLIQLIGFCLAAVGIVLISQSEGGAGRPQGFWLAILAGFGFAGFFICMKQTGASSALWSAALSRTASLVLVGAIVVVSGSARNIQRNALLLGGLAGCLDVTGTALYVRASQIGRLDAAVVLSSLYPAVTVLLARLLLKERFTRWKTVGMVTAILAVPMIALQ